MTEKVIDTKVLVHKHFIHTEKLKNKVIEIIEANKGGA
jgi:hypothetical protein